MLRSLNGIDVVKKASNRKLKYLFVFPGGLKPTGNGEIGRLERLDTECPIMFLDFPSGRLRCNGVLVHLANEYMTLSVRRAGVFCEDVFDKMVVFPTCDWFAKEGSQDTALPLPKELFSICESVQAPESLQESSQLPNQDSDSEHSELESDPDRSTPSADTPSQKRSLPRRSASRAALVEVSSDIDFMEVDDPNSRENSPEAD